MPRSFVGSLAMTRWLSAVAGVAMIIATVAPVFARQTTPDVAVKLAGTWKYRPDISTKPRAAGQTAEPSGGNRGAGGGNRGGGAGGIGGRGPGAGGIGGSGGGGGTAGGNGGGDGGYTGGIGGLGGGRVDVPAAALDQYFQTRAINREVAAAETLTISATGHAITFVNDLGDVRMFTVDGKKHKLDLLTVKVDATAQWQDDLLMIQMVAGRITVTQAFQVSVQGNMLVVDVRTGTTGSRRGGGQAIKRVYERVTLP